ncbi:NAD-dependent dehydratase [Enemella dayhoffiae]|uniref:NAD-dependent dehydratase n=1 Tax=Enemella dayhoffiae TaxID=2016507 RepID=A0A255HCV4_9ACTN|nr:NAD(P)H-binding protein [Enemella dayhoffiae]OYO25196.1 NAD-dependent dehydratase [Enemella dayhoffiae]
MARIALIGGHGKIALLAAPLLSADGHQVDSIIRNPDHLDDVADARANPVLADVESLDTDQLRELLRDHDVVIWSAGAGGGNPARTRAVDQEAAIRTMDAAGRAGVPRFVMVSYFGASTDHGVPEDNPFFAYAEAKAAADAHLRGTDLQWTILMPSSLTLEAGTGRIDATATQSGSVSRADVAEVIRAVVAADPAVVAGREISFNTGDTPISEVVAAA